MIYYYFIWKTGSNRGREWMNSQIELKSESSTNSQDNAKISSQHKALSDVLVAPGVGLEPARPRRATGSQAHVRLKACALIHSAYGMTRHVSSHYPGVLSRHWRNSHLIRSIFKCLPLGKSRVVDQELTRFCDVHQRTEDELWQHWSRNQLHSGTARTARVDGNDAQTSQRIYGRNRQTITIY